MSVEVKGLSKAYPLNRRKETFKEEVARFCRGERPQGVFYALSSIDFTVNPGELIGVMGRNGAGKSTLLKLLARVITPTSGKIILGGKVGALLEVGAGFHPELTGRENIFLSGAILGMRRREIVRAFDQIVSFAAIEQFLEMPVKKYSSGMFLRLAFSVIAHLESAILIIDEVLSVADQQFQEQCLIKIREMSLAGRTLFFVSHDEKILHSLCTRTLLLEEGKMVER